MNQNTNEVSYYNSFYAVQQHLQINAGIVKSVCEVRDPVKDVVKVLKMETSIYTVKFVCKTMCAVAILITHIIFKVWITNIRYSIPRFINLVFNHSFTMFWFDGDEIWIKHQFFIFINFFLHHMIYSSSQSCLFRFVSSLSIL